jgi:hypothetical protein
MPLGGDAAGRLTGGRVSDAVTIVGGVAGTMNLRRVCDRVCLEVDTSGSTVDILKGAIWCNERHDGPQNDKTTHLTFLMK